MSDPTKNPLNTFVSESPSTTAARLPEMPDLHAHVKEHGLMKGLEVHSQKMQETWQQLQKIIDERIQGKPPVSVSKP